jgi:hypothetical protein
MEGYLRAWSSNDPEDIRRLFAPKARYFTAPYRKPWEGRDGIITGWLGRKDEPGTYSFRYEILAVDGELGVVRGWTEYLEDPPRAYSNLWLVSLNDRGECREFVEFWMEEE